ncbi:MAG: hypothetical protein K2N89_15330 [Lachnospiraceae bacterium]|nr:hypothetical protein [Lachnospiraceae bacterium]
MDRNRVGEKLFPYPCAGHPSAYADIFLLGARVHVKGLIYYIQAVRRLVRHLMLHYLLIQGSFSDRQESFSV